MKSISVNLGFYKFNRTFPSYSYFLSYLFDLLAKILLLILIIFIPVAYLLDYSIFIELNRVLLMLNIAVFVFFLMLIRRVIIKQAVVRGSFDMMILFFATFSLISVSLSSQKVVSVFGRVGLNEYSIISILTILILFFAYLEAFSYKRGYKWLLAALTIATLMSGIWYTYQIKYKDWVFDNAYYSFIFFTFPVLIANIFIFKKLWLRVLSFLGVLACFVLIGTQQVNVAYQVETALWSISAAAFVAVVIVYFKLWMYNTDKVLDMFSDISKSIKDRKNIILLVILILVAVLIIVFGYNVFKTLDNKIYPPFRPTLDQLEDTTIKEIVFGQGLNETSSRSSWIVGLTTSLGILSTLVFLILELMLIFKTIRNLDINLLISDFNRFIVKVMHFVVALGIFLFTIFAQMNSLITLLLILFLVIYSKPQKSIIFLEKNKKASYKTLAVKVLIAAILLAAMVFLYIGIGRAIEKETFAIGKV